MGDDFRTEIQVHMLDFNEENKPEEKTSSHLLDKFGVNLTRMAREGKIDPVVGREQEIERARPVPVQVACNVYRARKTTGENECSHITSFC